MTRSFPSPFLSQINFGRKRKSIKAWEQRIEEEMKYYIYLSISVVIIVRYPFLAVFTCFYFSGACAVEQTYRKRTKCRNCRNRGVSTFSPFPASLCIYHGAVDF